MLEIWFRGTTPHRDGGLMIESARDELSAMLKKVDEQPGTWLNVELVNGGVLTVRPEHVIAYQEAE